MLTRRVQILLDDEQFRRLESHARERGLSVGACVREAIDRVVPSDAARRKAAARAILAVEPIEVGGVEALKRELDEIRGSRFP